MGGIVRGIAISAALVVACSAPPGAGTTGAAATATATATAAAASASPTPAASPTPRPTPLVSSKGTITVAEPATGEQLASPITISGDATVFEGTLLYRVVTAGGTVLAEGQTTATAGAPQKGTFTVQVSFRAPYSGEGGFVEVFERSPKDGTISDIVRVPVSIIGSY